MRDAFGGAFMIRLFIVFIFIYMVFTAMALNYAKAFKAKNRVIDYLEDNEISEIDKNVVSSMAWQTYLEEMVLKDLGYNVPTENMVCTGDEDYCANGIRITSIKTKSDAANHVIYYKVETYFNWTIPFLRKLTELNSNSQPGETPSGVWAISGETRPIVVQ